MSFHEINLERANKYIEKNKHKIASSDYRPNYHFATPVGWLNDPNGFIKYKGEYHLFYQFHPYDAYWGPMHWGHAKSKDLINWEELPVALAPSEFYDNDEQGGCFSGTSIEKDDKLFVFYTGTVTKKNQSIQTQCLAISEDGINFEKHKSNPIIQVDYPGVATDNFRDPKVWEANGLYHMIVGVSIDGKGNALYYTSENLIDWDLKGPFVEYNEDLGTMWECPDFFSLDDKAILLFSPMGLKNNINLYLVGRMDYKKGKFIFENKGKIDNGFDFYAPQTLKDENNRRLMIGWQNGWEWMPWWENFGPTSEYSDWCGTMSLPREITLKGTELMFSPISNISSYVKNKFYFEDVFVWKKKNKLISQINESFIMSIKLDDCTGKLSIMIENDEKMIDEITFSDGVFEYKSKNNPFGKNGNSMNLKNEKELLIFSDSSSLEVFGVETGKSFSLNSFMNTGKRNISINSEQPNIIKKIEIKEIRI